MYLFVFVRRGANDPYMNSDVKYKLQLLEYMYKISKNTNDSAKYESYCIIMITIDNQVRL